MNEQEFHALVARARDAEGAATRPPPGLVNQARAVARRRRRLLTAGAGAAVAAVMVTSIVGPQLVGNDTSPDDAPLGGAKVGELAANGGPCPATLPAPVDDPGGYGFGTRTSAQEEPRFTAPDTGWVCRYDPARIGQTSEGSVVEWSLNAAPRRLGENVLSQVSDVTNAISVFRGPSADRPCPANLGPRYALVTSAGGDLTGVIADSYGCGDVRLSDDPFLTAPGDPQEGNGTTPGVFPGADSEGAGLAVILQDWWDTSPPDVDAGPVPDELRVTCTDTGPRTQTTTVTATPGGVTLLVDSTLSQPGSYLTYTSEALTGGDNIDQIDNPATYTFPPGKVTLGCASPPNMDETSTVTIEVVDPHGYWRPSTLTDFGCPPGGQPAWKTAAGKGPTAQAAVEDLLAGFADAAERDVRDFREYTAEAAPTGYSGSDTRTWIGARNGAPSFSIRVTQSATSFTAHPDMLCGQR